MSALSVTATCTIFKGQRESFKEIATRIFDKVRGAEPGTLAYAAYFNEDETVCVVRERYASSDAVLAHLAHVGADLGALGATCALSVEIFGDPSPALLAATAAMQPKIYRPFLSI